MKFSSLFWLERISILAPADTTPLFQWNRIFAAREMISLCLVFVSHVTSSHTTELSHFYSHRTRDNYQMRFERDAPRGKLIRDSKMGVTQTKFRTLKNRPEAGLWQTAELLPSTSLFSQTCETHDSTLGSLIFQKLYGRDQERWAEVNCFDEKNLGVPVKGTLIFISLFFLLKEGHFFSIVFRKLRRRFFDFLFKHMRKHFK